MLFSSSAPENFQRRILLALAGLSPQAITETLYYLCCVRKPAFIPTEVHIITTSEGRNILEMALLHKKGGKFHAFLKDYGLEGQIEFTFENVHVLTDNKGTILRDVRTRADNDTAADEITARVRHLTTDPDCALHVSISGGRNTMGLYLGYAMSLFGRPQDRLSHVLVPTAFQNNHDFYYPPPEPEVLVSRTNRLISTDKATITLAEIPYVSLRHALPEELLNGESSYTNTVAEARRSFDPPSIEIDIVSKRLVCAGQEVSMPPQLFAWYVWMARRCKEHGEQESHVRWTDNSIAEEFLSEYRRVVGDMAYDFETTADMLANGMTQDFFQEKKAKVNRWLKKELKLVAEPYLIRTSGCRPIQKFGLEISPSRISII